MTDKDKIEEIVNRYGFYLRGMPLQYDKKDQLVQELETLLKERERELLNKIPKGYTRKIKIGESDYACKQLKCTMKDIKEHNIESEGFDLGYKTAIDDIQKWKTEYLQSNNLEG